MSPSGCEARMAAFKRERGIGKYCAVPHCKGVAEPIRLMCFPHWMQIPLELQRAIYGPGDTWQKAAEEAMALFPTEDPSVETVQTRGAEGVGVTPPPLPSSAPRAGSLPQLSLFGELAAEIASDPA